MKKVVMMTLILIAVLLFVYGEKEKAQLAYYNDQYQSVINTNK